MRLVPHWFAALALLTGSLCGPGVWAQENPGNPPGDGGIRGLRIDSVFAPFDNTRSPGCAVGVLEEGGLAFGRGYGMANLDHGIAITPETIFRIGSVSKQFTAAVVVLLAREGLFSLEDGIRRFFPELPELYGPVTVRNLLNHTSGIRDYLELMGMRGVGDEATYTEDDVVRLLSRQRALNFHPGSDFRYSNSGYLLLSRLVYRVTGRTLRQEAQRLLFEPLGMERTHFHDDHREIVPHRATGYGSGRDGRFFVDQTTLDIVGDGGVFTSIEDLYRWMANFWALEVGGPDWLSTMETPGVLTDGDTLDYAMGLRRGVHRGLFTVGHGGAFVGYRAATLRYPGQEVAVMVLCNYARTNPSQLAEEVGEIWLEERMAPEPEPQAGPEPLPQPRREQTSVPVLSSEEQRPFLGEYYSQELDATYRIIRGEGGLVLDVNGVETLPLERSGPNTLTAQWLTLTLRMEGDSVVGFRAGSGRAGGVEFERR
ncbi:serine hydrolase domain-containing protein [Gemmatimonadota bacterium]